MFSRIEHTIKSYIRHSFEELKTFYLLFKRENVFKYLLIIIGLMLICGFLFMVLEADRVIAANPDKKLLGLYDKLVTVMYWSITTIATVGYGDISPGTSTGRIMAGITMYLSICTVALFSANLSSALTTKKLMERLRGRGLALLQKQKDLFIICGWKNGMAGLVKNILKLNTDLEPENMVIIADIHDEDVHNFKNDPVLEDVNFVQGQYFMESVLRSVNLSDSRKVMVFADTKGNESEVDSRTFMTVITIKNIAARAYVCAEILNPSFENYLKMTNCDEIILIKEYSRILIANASSSVGVAHIIQDLLGLESPAALKTEKVPEAFILRPYNEYRQHVFKNTSDILLGILENTGTLIEMKRHAIREAQKVADMTKLVNGLKHLKTIEGNKPQLNPPGEYLIPKNSMGIFIRRGETPLQEA